MYNRKQLFFSVMICALFWVSQVQGQQRMSLAECLTYALENNEQYKIKEIEKSIAKSTIKETIATGLPQINASLSVVDNLSLQKSLVDATLFNPDAKSGELLELEFGLPYTSVANIGFSQLLFSGSYFVGVKAAKTLEQLRQKELEVEHADLISNVTKAYYGALVNKERLEYLEVNVKRLDTLLYETNELLKTGFVEKIDVSRIKIAKNNTLSALKQTRIGTQIAIEILKFQMGMPISETLELSENLKSLKLDESLIDLSNFDKKGLAKYTLGQNSIMAAKWDLKYTKSQHLPTLVLTGNLGYNFASPALSDIGTFGIDNGSRWRDYANISIGLSFPIFDGFKKRHSANLKRFKIEQAQERLDQISNSIDLEIKQQQLTYNQKLKELKVQKENMTLSKEIYDVTQLKYKEGLGSNIDVIDAEAAMKEAQTNYYAALYEALVSRVNMDKALGKFDKI